jgi:hypothetical protein
MASIVVSKEHPTVLFRRGEVGAEAECFVSPFQRAFIDMRWQISVK